MNPFRRRRGGVPTKEQNYKATGIITLRQQRLQTLPQAALNAAAAARVLDAAYNKLKTVPSSISAFTHLTRLVLSFNRLISLPDALSQLQHLKVLLLDHNKLEELNETVLVQLHLLEQLDVSYNLLRQLCSSCTLRWMHSLKEVHASNNRLEHVLSDEADAACDVSPLAHSLERVDVSENIHITCIPQCFAQLKALHKLNFDGNNVKHIPAPVFKECESLAVLSLHRNPCITRSHLEAMDGYQEFVARLKRLKNKHVWSGAIIDEHTLDEGFDA